MRKLWFELRMLMFSSAINVALFVLPKEAQETLEWLSKMPIESEGETDE